MVDHSVMADKKPLAQLAIGLLLTAAAGCAPLLFGAGAVGGYAISKDSISNTFDLPFDQVYDASHAAMAKNGLITQADSHRGLIKATVPGANVTVTVTRLTMRTVQLKVKARNDIFLPKIDIAQSLYNAIVEKL